MSRRKNSNFMVDYRKGLNDEEVQARIKSGDYNSDTVDITDSVRKIFLKNIITPFNVINLALALAVILVGQPRQALFFIVAVLNTALGIFQELRAKKTLDKLSIVAKGKVKVVRNGELVEVPQNKIVLDEILKLESGQQLCVDAKIVKSDGLEFDESLLTGESTHVTKIPGDNILSGSFVIAGSGYAMATAVGEDSYAEKLSIEAKKAKKQNAPLIKILNNIIKVMAIIIIPIGLLLFYNQYDSSGNLSEAVVGSTAAMVGMIPEGLILLTGITLMLGAVKLANKKALVQSLPCIETLARADVLCLDKTGTITDGTLSFEEIIPLKKNKVKDTEKIIAEMMVAIGDNNNTSNTLRQAFRDGGVWKVGKKIPFSSERKWSAASFKDRGSFVLGAPDFVLQDMDDNLRKKISSYTKKGLRVLCLASSETELNTKTKDLPSDITPVSLVVLSDTIRAEAPDTFAHFTKQGVELKVISGDNTETVSTIAEKAGIKGAKKCIDMSKVRLDDDYRKLVKKYVVFGRVSPEQKKSLVIALKDEGHTVCMTGDGVNDVLALKEADASVAMVDGSDAARGAADFVLMTSDFSVMIDVLNEGRRVINNIENVACLYLVKTAYSIILSVLYMMIPYPYPFSPLQMTPINLLTVGAPSFFLALRPNYKKPEGRFLRNVLENSIPTALCVVVNILIIQIIGHLFNLSQLEISTMNIILIGAAGFSLLIKLINKNDKTERNMVALLIAGFILSFVLFKDFLGYNSLISRNVVFYVPLLILMPKLFDVMVNLFRGVTESETYNKLYLKLTKKQLPTVE